MAKVIVYKCDFCDWADDATVTNGSQVPRKLWMMGYMEACSDCLKRAQDFLTHLRDNKDDQGL